MSKSVKDLLKQKYGIIRPIKKINGGFYCAGKNLTSLEGSPKEVGGDFDISSNKLTSLEGCPEIVYGYFNCENNKKKFMIIDVEHVCQVGTEGRGWGDIYV